MRSSSVRRVIDVRSITNTEQYDRHADLAVTDRPLGLEATVGNGNDARLRCTTVENGFEKRLGPKDDFRVCGPAISVEPFGTHRGRCNGFRDGIIGLFRDQFVPTVEAHEVVAVIEDAHALTDTCGSSPVGARASF